MGWTRGPIIGSGSTAVVSTTTSDAGDILAVKSCLLHRSFSLQNEQKIMSNITTSPHIVTYMGSSVSKQGKDLFFNLFLEYLPRGTLSDEIQRRGDRLPEPELVSYTRQILLGLAHLHSVGIVHCDIKGQNILVGEEGLKIADLGCARRSPVVDKEAPAVAGTPLYMAPEVVRGEEQGCAADVWALGCTVVEMGTGRGPWPEFWSDRDPVRVLYHIGYSGQAPEFPGHLSEEGRDFLEKCLRRNPRERWTASQLLEHPFLVKFDSLFCSSLQVKKSEDLNDSNSPTSILDQGIWSSIEECNTQLSLADGNDLVGLRLGVGERIRELEMVSRLPRWELDDDDDDWITIRGG